jgi:hypothetical protein
MSPERESRRESNNLILAETIKLRRKHLPKINAINWDLTRPSLTQEQEEDRPKTTFAPNMTGFVPNDTPATRQTTYEPSFQSRRGSTFEIVATDTQVTILEKNFHYQNSVRPYLKKENFFAKRGPWGGSNRSNNMSNLSAINKKKLSPPFFHQTLTHTPLEKSPSPFLPPRFAPDTHFNISEH